MNTASNTAADKQHPQAVPTAPAAPTAKAELTGILAKSGSQTFRIRSVSEQIFAIHGDKYGFRLVDRGVFDPVRRTL